MSCLPCFHVSSLLPCGNLLGICWPLRTRLWCLIVFLSLSHVPVWYLFVSIPDLCQLSYFPLSVCVVPLFCILRIHWSGITKNQVPHLTQDTNGKVTNSQLETTNESQEVSPFPAGDQKAHINRRTQRHSKHETVKHKRSTKEDRLGTVSKIFYWRA